MTLKRLLTTYLILFSCALFAGGSVPVISFPVDGLNETPTEFHYGFVHAAHEHFYDIEYDTTPNFNSPEYQYRAGNVDHSAFGVGVILEYKIWDLLYGTKYYWRTRSRNATDTTDWNTVRSFVTIDSPSINTPTSGSTVNPANFSISTIHNIGNTGYIIEGSKDFSFTYPIYYRQIHDAYTIDPGINQGENLAISINGMPNSGKFYFRMRVKNDRDSSEWSNIMIYHMDGTLSTLEKDQVDFKVYPNPASSKLFVHHQQSLRRAELIDITGKTILNFENNQQSNLTPIDISKVKPGSYFVKVYFQNGTNKVTKILIK